MKNFIVIKEEIELIDNTPTSTGIFSVIYRYQDEIEQSFNKVYYDINNYITLEIPIDKDYRMITVNNLTELNFIDDPIAIEKFKVGLHQRINELSEELIISGFESSALGEPYIYNSDVESQLNIIGNVQKGGTVKHRCTNKQTGIKDRIDHTEAQMLQVFNDGYIRKTTILQKSTDFKRILDNLDLSIDLTAFEIEINSNWNI